MDLKPYWQKRHFDETPEPRGEWQASGTDLAFVVQMHAASHLHFDFRLEIGGVLKSWAVPKGPSPDPAEKRLAVEVEDHPLAYGRFEGVIPVAQYGGGTVMVWDRGRWIPDGDPVEAWRRGHIRFVLLGRKLAGRWSLLRMKGNGKKGENGKANWLLVKAKDEFAGREIGTGQETAVSVLSGRTLKQIAQGKKGRVETGELAVPAPREKKPARKSALGARGKKTQALPDRMEPQLASLVAEAPRDGTWLSELKFDGYRILARLQENGVSLWTRNHHDWTSLLPDIAADLARLDLPGSWLDGELVAVDREGHGSFELLQQSFRKGERAVRDESRLLYYVFDAPWLAGEDLRELPQEERKQRLKKALRPSRLKNSALRYSDHIKGRLQEVYEQACLQGEEGIIIKSAAAPYRSGRGRHWLKLKCLHRQEFVVGAYTDPEGGRAGFGALLLGYFDDAQRFIHVGRTGTGFDDSQLRHLHHRLCRLERKTSPFEGELSAQEKDGAHWVSPQLVVEVKFSGWTRHQRLRQAVFLGLRDDKEAELVHQEKAVAPPAAGAPEKARKKPDGKTRKRSTSRRDAELAGVRISHPQREVYPGAGYSKRDVARYYADMAARVLPHLADRPLSVLRCPDGIAAGCFFQKHMTDAMPDFLRTVAVPEKAGTALYMLASDSRSLVGLVQMGVIEFHAWEARRDRLDRPDRMIFDLDPGPGVTWQSVKDGAVLLQALLQELELPCYLKTSGGKGLHVEVPLLRVHTWDEVKNFSHHVVLHLEAELPDRFVASAAKAKRKSRIFIDYLRNAEGATTVTPYSLRAREGAPVATPLRWKELPDIESAAAFTLANIRARVAGLTRDPWAAYENDRTRISKRSNEALRKLTTD